MPQRRACRTRRLRARPARTTRCGRGRCTRRRRGRSRPVPRAAGAGRTGPGRHTPSSPTSARIRASSASPSCPLGPPTISKVTSGSSSAASDSIASAETLQRLDASREQQDAPAVEAELGACGIASRRARTRCGRRRARTISMRSGSASYSDASCARSSSVDASIRSAHAMTSCSMRARSSGIVVDARVGLHASKRVERRRERKVERVLQLVRDRAPRASSSRAAPRLVATRRATRSRR